MLATAEFAITNRTYCGMVARVYAICADEQQIGLFCTGEKARKKFVKKSDWHVRAPMFLLRVLFSLRAQTACSLNTCPALKSFAALARNDRILTTIIVNS